MPLSPPLGPDQRVRLINTAAEIFVLNGFAAATTDMIARAAGMSKKTLYRLFDSKVALFDAVIESRFFDLQIVEQPVGPDMATTLTQLLRQMAAILLQPDRLALIRLIVTDRQATPELSTAFQRLKVDREFNLLEDWLRRHAEAGLLRPTIDVPHTARVLFGMSIGEPMLAALIGAPSCCGVDPIEDGIALAVGIFLQGLTALPHSVPG